MQRIIFYLLTILLWVGYLVPLSALDLKNHVIKINGKVTCQKEEGDIIGVYGAKAILYMLDKNGNIISPTGIGLDPKQLQTEIAPDGTFSINIDMLANMSIFTKVFLEIFPGGAYGQLHYDELQYITQTSQGKLSVWNDIQEGEPFRGVELDFNPNQTNHLYENIAIKVNGEVGTTVRYFKIGYEFAKYFFADLGENTTVPPIIIHLLKTMPKHNEMAGYMNVHQGVHGPNDYAQIFIKRTGIGSTLPIAHEYGHYIHYVLNNTFFDESRPKDATMNAGKEGSYSIIAEGVAEFFGMASRNYASAKYGDLLCKSGNIEMTPFYKDPFKYCYYSDTYEIPRFATYLWNIYDGPTQKYIASPYKSQDNDDIDGAKEKIYKKAFHLLKTLSNSDLTMTNFLKEFKASIANDVEVAKSVEDIYQFLFKDATHLMRPAQVKETKLNILFEGDQYLLQVETYEYAFDTQNIYKSQAQGYKLYGKKNNTWVLLKSLPYTKNKLYSLTPQEVGEYINFKITAYNASGESLNPYYFTYNKLSVNIEGSSKIFADLKYMWKAKVNNGKAPYTYLWKMKKTNTDSYFEAKDNKNLSFLPPIPKGDDFILQLFVIDKDGLSGYAELKVDNTIRPIVVNIQGVTSIGVNQDTTWEAVATGGLPPYSYNWSKKVTGDFKDLYLGQSKTVKTSSDKNFALKLVVEDTQKSHGFATQQITINENAPILANITGDKLVYLHKEANWQVNIEGGKPNYQITWLKRKENEISFTEIGQGDAYKKEIGGEEGIFYLKTKVKDSKNQVKESPEFKVTAIYQPLYVVITNENVVLKPSEKINWLATITGGKPNYKYLWQVGKSLDKLSKIQQGTIYNGFNASCLYQPTLNATGKYLIVLTITDELDKSITISKEFEVKALGLAPNQGQELEATYYPNPTQGNIKLQYVLEEEAEVVITAIAANTNQNTELVRNKMNKGAQIQNINLSTLPNGNYFIKLHVKHIDGRSYIKTERIVLNK